MNNQIKLRENEGPILMRIRKKWNAGAVRLFRNTVGMYKSDAGHVIRYGLGEDSPDLIGWTLVEITPDMVGLTLPIFTAIEVKRPGDEPRPGQLTWLNAVKRVNGLSGWTDNDDEGVKKIIDPKNLLSA